MDAPLVRMRGVWKRYRMGKTEVPALRNIDLEIPAGEFVVFLGPSGSGKTTLLNIVGGLDTVSEGEVLVNGRVLAAQSEAALTVYRRETIGFVFQFFNLVPTLTAKENVELVAQLAKSPRDPGEVLRSVGLAGREHHFPSAMSGGEQQRVAIARALVKRPALVLADEPTGNLDIETAIIVLRVLRDAQRADGHGVLLVTHNQDIARMADRVVRLHGGSLAGVEEVANPVEPEELQW